MELQQNAALLAFVVIFMGINSEGDARVLVMVGIAEALDVELSALIETASE